MISRLQAIAALAAAAAIAGTAPPPPAAAQSSPRAASRLRTVPIVIPRGQVCFRHEGVGTTFVGQFRRDQLIYASSTGDADFGDDRGEWIATQERDLFVSWGGGDGDNHGFEDGRPLAAPVTGRYTFTYSPNAMVGGRGVFIVCAL